MKGKKYTPLQLLFLKRAFRILSTSALTLAFNDLFDEDRTVGAIQSVLRDYGFKSGRSGDFKKGCVPWNKGTKGLVSSNVGNFKKGHVAYNRKPLGSEHISAHDGYTQIKVPETDPYTGRQTRYKAKQIHVWEQANGPVPDGLVVFFIDGYKTNCNLENLELVNRTELLFLNQFKYKDAAPELKPSILAMARLKAKASLVVRNAK